MKNKTRHLIGRDPAKGRLAFKTGVILNEKDRLRNRKSKLARVSLRRQLNCED
jgi:hypothetical protein